MDSRVQKFIDSFHSSIPLAAVFKKLNINVTVVWSRHLAELIHSGHQ